MALTSEPSPNTNLGNPDPPHRIALASAACSYAGSARPHCSATRAGAGYPTWVAGGTSRAVSSRRRATPPSGWSSSVRSLVRVRVRLRLYRRVLLWLYRRVLWLSHSPGVKWAFEYYFVIEPMVQPSRALWYFVAHTRPAPSLPLAYLQPWL
jgi:hypothetical protein